MSLEKLHPSANEATLQAVDDIDLGLCLTLQMCEFCAYSLEIYHMFFFGFVFCYFVLFCLFLRGGGGCFLFCFGLVWLFVCLFFVNIKNRNIPWLHKDNPGLLFTKRWDVLPSNLVTSRSHQIGCYNDRIPLKFDRALPRCLPNCRAIRKV